MDLQQRISSFASLGAMLRAFVTGPAVSRPGPVSVQGWEADLLDAMEASGKDNGWFTRDSMLMALSYWGDMLDLTHIETWLARYNPALEKASAAKKVGVIMAGNIPMVGFHDLLTVLLSGNRLVGRLSSQDQRIIPHLVSLLESVDSGWSEFIELTTREIEKPDAIIATGSNNTSRYFSYYFSKYPHIIRKNRTGVAVLDGKETTTELEGLALDIFSYFGLGCRNVSKLYLPEGYDFNPLHEAFLPYQQLFHHQKYRNNLDYYRSIYLVNRTPILDGIFYLLVETQQLSSPVSVLHYEYYNDPAQAEEMISIQKEQIQCVVSRKGFLRNDLSEPVVLPGRTQLPALSDYADGVDTMQFLLEKI